VPIHFIDYPIERFDESGLFEPFCQNSSHLFGKISSFEIIDDSREIATYFYAALERTRGIAHSHGKTRRKLMKKIHGLMKNQ
jgi:hypothetical protein